MVILQPGARSRGSDSAIFWHGPRTPRNLTSFWTDCVGTAVRKARGACRVSFLIDTDICSAHPRGNRIVSSEFVQRT